MNEVRRVATLARLCLRPAEEEALDAEVGHIIQVFRKLSTVDTSGIPPTENGGTEGVAFRDDVVTNPPASDALLANAPALEGRYFRVPKILP